VANQYGFQKGQTTDGASFKLINEILDALNNKMKTGSIFCDLQKAFDTVNHKLLLDKLHYYGITGKAKTLLESYLRGKYQRVQITNESSNISTLSNWTTINQGVPQGSILGLLLFLIYINDLPKAVETTAIPIIFADDTSLYIKSLNNSQLQIGLNTAICKINNWFQDSLITLNLNKTYFIQFINKNMGNPDIKLSLKINKLSQSKKQNSLD
jgi:hypothetical protein